MTKEPIKTVVDYAAWEKGYMPPSEHVLIDQLSYRGARVVMSSDFGDQAYWLVVRGARLYGRNLLRVRAAIESALDALAEEEAAQVSEGGDAVPACPVVPEGGKDRDTSTSTLSE